MYWWLWVNTFWHCPQKQTVILGLMHYWKEWGIADFVVFSDQSKADHSQSDQRRTFNLGWEVVKVHYWSKACGLLCKIILSKISRPCWFCYLSNHFYFQNSINDINNIVLPSPQSARKLAQTPKVSILTLDLYYIDINLLKETRKSMFVQPISHKYCPFLGSAFSSDS